MTKEDIQYWLKEGEQSKITPEMRKIADKFTGNDFEKIWKILEWIDKNIKSEDDHKKVLKIFATRTADKIIKDKIDTGCHDTALLLVAFLRTVGIPAKYVFGIDKIKTSRGGHCVAEAYVNKKWILIDPSYFKINLDPSRSEFYMDNHIMKKRLDSWDCGIKTVSDWKKASEKLIKHIQGFKTK